MVECHQPASVLRTRFVWEGIDEPEQVVEPQISCQIDYHDWRVKQQQEHENALDEVLEIDRYRDFTMSETPFQFHKL